MVLCDIGNSDIKILHDNKFSSMNFEEFEAFQSEERVFYINVNERLKKLAAQKPNFINLEQYFDFDSIYQGLGVDRIAACYTINDGVVVDAGSAISVDIMSNATHLGGFILPGIASFRKAYAEISVRLKCEFNTQLYLDALPQRTMDAVSYGTFKSIYLLIKDAAQGHNIYFTGGDGRFLERFFDKAIFDKLLVFRGMQRVIEQNSSVLLKKI